MLCFQLKEAAVVKTETITMTMREVDRLKTIQAVVAGELTALMAADRLRLTKRQVNRLVMRYTWKALLAWYRASAASRVIASLSLAWPRRH